MTRRTGLHRATLGFTVKSGWAASVLLTGSAGSPQVADCRRVELSDPDDPDARQPYHAGFGTARQRGQELTRLLASVRRFGTRSVNAVIQEMKAGHDLAGAGLVVGSLIEPEGIANDHIRIHALEGKLFRGVIEESLQVGGIPCSIWRERDLHAAAAELLRLPDADLRSALTSLGAGSFRPWRTEQKAAALAAWMVLGHPARQGR